MTASLSQSRGGLGWVSVPIRLAMAAAAATLVALVVPAAAATPSPASSALFSFSDPRIDESSGIVASSFDGTFYTFNDSGDSARFFRVDDHGNTVAVYTLRGATNVDWEDMASGTDSAGDRVLYFADTGDNDRTRKEIAVYMVPEPRGPSTDVTWTRYRFAYPDGAHDAEALLVDPRSHRIYVATKELLTNGKIYEAPATLSKTGINMLTPVGSDPPLTTSTDFAPDGSRVVLLTYLGAFWADDVGATWHRFDVPLPPQAEAIAYTRDGSSVLVGGEGAHATIYQASAPSADPATAPPAAPSSATASAPAPAPATTATGSAASSGLPIGVLIAVAVVVGVGVVAVVAGVLISQSRRRR
jgi:hypothetical protein